MATSSEPRNPVGVLPEEFLTRSLPELQIRLLRTEAEAVILYGPAFPDNQFAR
jgi:hypothetical protein